MKKFEDDGLDELIEKLKRQAMELDPSSPEYQRVISELIQLESTKMQRQKMFFEMECKEEEMFREAEADERKELRERKEAEKKRKDSIWQFGVTTAVSLIGIAVPAGIMVTMYAAEKQSQSDGNLPSWITKGLIGKLYPNLYSRRG